ncbi:hypothetical protein BDW02DRAFT_108643 [Decorospora gaudefroyi]|uniref:Uncharacterized protein n=1 Tax=Decorospora gaudefroyi TaxID=184978 RepID=A0A6A5KRV0_9PLEO|nr:hypothetical protein BDW02DRAFT_108643 [Decorospora gaudefroyi]
MKRRISHQLAINCMPRTKFPAQITLLQDLQPTVPYQQTRPQSSASKRILRRKSHVVPIRIALQTVASDIELSSTQPNFLQDSDGHADCVEVVRAGQAAIAVLAAGALAAPMLEQRQISSSSIPIGLPPRPTSLLSPLPTTGTTPSMLPTGMPSSVVSTFPTLMPPFPTTIPSFPTALPPFPTGGLPSGGLPGTTGLTFSVFPQPRPTPWELLV